MKAAIKNLKATTIDFLKKKIGKISNYQDANKLLSVVCGIDKFFEKQKEFLNLLELLKPHFMVCEDSNRREYGDFQTPHTLTDSICSYLCSQGISPDIIIEPTFGKGSFLISALKYFPELKKIYGIEIYESYYWESKFAILELFINKPDLNKPEIFLCLNDVFNFDLMKIEKQIENNNILILGNPPWVTNAELSTLNSTNLPKKINIKSLNGLDAITGNGNFDISESIILTMLNSFSKYHGHIAILAKNSVIKNLLYYLPNTNYKINNMVAFKIDAKKHFNASVEASLFKGSFSSNKLSLTCKVSSFIHPTAITNEFDGLTINLFPISLFMKRIKNMTGFLRLCGDRVLSMIVLRLWN